MPRATRFIVEYKAIGGLEICSIALEVLKEVKYLRNV